MQIEVMAFWRGRKGRNGNGKERDRKGREGKGRREEGEGARQQGMKRECVSLGCLSERGRGVVSV